MVVAATPDACIVDAGVAPDDPGDGTTTGRRPRSGSVRSSTPPLISWNRSSWLTHVSTSRQLPCRKLPSVCAMSSRASIVATFLLFISPKLLRNVNLASVVMNALRSSSRPKKHTILMASLNPSSAMRIVSASFEFCSGADMPARNDIHATSNIGFTCSMCDALKYRSASARCTPACCCACSMVRKSTSVRFAMPCVCSTYASCCRSRPTVAITPASPPDVGTVGASSP